LRGRRDPPPRRASDSRCKLNAKFRAQALLVQFATIPDEDKTQGNADAVGRSQCERTIPPLALVASRSRAMASHPRLRRLFWTWILPLLGVAALCLALWAYLAPPRERAFHLRMTAGSEAGARHELAEMLRDEVASSGVVLELRGGHGSEEA